MNAESPGAPGGGQQPGRPRGMSPAQIETWVDQTIRQAQRRGDFDNLPGAGKPLISLDQPNDPDWWIKDLIKREKVDLTAALPGPMALRRERERYPESLLPLPDEAAVRAVLEDFNARVIADRKRPYAGQGSPAIVGRVDVEQMVQRWLTLRAAVAESARSAAEALELQSPSELTAARSRRAWWRRRRSR